MKFFIYAIVINVGFIFSSSQAGSDKPQIKINNAWIRPAAKDANTALYFIIINSGIKPDTLIDARSTLAEIVEVHESYKMSNDRIGMKQVKSVAIMPKSKIEFYPGGYHVMILGVYKDYKIGDEFNAVLIFKHAGKIKIKAVVKDSN